jgi:uncharacterized peroxidase-related enzyme
MSLLKTIAPEEATGEVAQLYERIKQGFGSVPTSFQSLSASPALLKQQLDFVGYYVPHPTLSPALLACIRMLVSRQTHCEYCIGMNAGLLVNMMGWTPEQVAATQADPAAANLPEREKAMLLFVLATVRDALAVTAADVDVLRAQGWSDADILDATHHGARMLAVDILLNAFKIERDF